MKWSSVLLLPIAGLYAGVTWLRNRCFDLGVLRSAPAVLPTVVIGNLTVGGTGKTPHALAIFDMLAEKYQVALLSRGYRRSSKGFVMATAQTTVQDLGDEPFMLYHSLPQKHLAVCADRLHGVRKLKDAIPALDVVVLDDAFQHRALKGSFNLLLTSYQQLYYEDYALPAGRLRDNRREAARAHAVIVTKCPPELTRAEMSEIESRIDTEIVVFSALDYGKPIGINGHNLEVIKDTPVLAFAGIAMPEPFFQYLGANFSLKKTKVYPDHHELSSSDIQSLQQDFDTFVGRGGVIVTTEKDAVKLMAREDCAMLPICFIPVSVKWLTSPERMLQTMEKAIERAGTK